MSLATGVSQRPASSAPTPAAVDVAWAETQALLRDLAAIGHGKRLTDDEMADLFERHDNHWL